LSKDISILEKTVVIFGYASQQHYDRFISRTWAEYSRIHRQIQRHEKTARVRDCGGFGRGRRGV
jgi:hypothetical protein